MLIVVLARCTDVTISDPTAPHLLEVGDTVAVFPSADGPILAGVRQLALAADGQSVFVLDSDPAVHRIGLDGTLLASFGREGAGPGELARPISLQPASTGGVWVLDRQRVTLFGPDGAVEHELALTNRGAGTFAPVGDRTVVIPAGQPGAPTTELLTRVRSDGVADLRNPGNVPGPLVSTRGTTDRFLGWKMAALGRRDVAIVLNGPELRGWRAVLNAEMTAIDSLAELSMPAGAVEVVAEASRAAAMPDARPSPLWRVGTAAGRLWVVSNGLPNGPVAFTVPLAEGEPSVQVAAGDGFHERGHRIRDLIVLSDRMFVARAIDVVVRAVEPF